MSYLRYPLSAGEKDACGGSYGTPGTSNPFATATDPGILFEYGPRTTAVWCDVWQPKYGATPADCVDQTGGLGVIPTPVVSGGELAIRLEVTGVGASIRNFGCPITVNQGVYQAAKNCVVEWSSIFSDLTDTDCVYQFRMFNLVGAEDSAWMVIDPGVYADWNVRLVTKLATVPTTTDSGLTCTAGVRYYWRMALTATSATLYRGTTYANLSPITAPHTTNIPALGMCLAAVAAAGGVCNPQHDCFDVRAYQNA